MEIVFAVIYLIVIYVNKKVLGQLINGFTIVFAPYVVIILANNYVFKDFYRITDGSIMIILLGMIIYEASFMLFYSTYARSVNYRRDKRLQIEVGNLDLRVNYKLIRIIVTLIVVIRLVSVIVIYLNGGLVAVAADNYSALNLGPIGGRLILFLYPFGWMLFNGLYSKKTKAKAFDVLLVLLIGVIQFMSYVKAHVAVYIIGLYIIACIRNTRNLLRGGLFLLGISLFLFFGNYALRWIAADSSAPSLDYTINHFWKYIAGGTINLQGTAFSGTTQYHFFDYWFQVLSPIPNELVTPFGLSINSYGSSFFPYIANMALVSSRRSEYSNVINIFGFFYGSGGINFVGFVINTMIYALFTEYNVFRLWVPRNMASFVLSVSCIVYSFLSFFSLYFATSAFWQICFYSYIVTWMFSGGIREFSA